jgi:hypothetical protein
LDLLLRRILQQRVGTFGSPESFAYCVAETVRPKTARGKPRPGLGNLHSASDFQLIATERTPALLATSSSGI